jgi:hypothetical protein
MGKVRVECKSGLVNLLTFKMAYKTKKRLRPLDIVQTSAAHFEPALNDARMAQPAIDCQYVKVSGKLGRSSTLSGCRID